MHRTIEITVPPESTETLIKDLEEMEHVIGLSVHRGASIKPPGDVLTVHALNRGADGVLRAVERAQQYGSVSVATAELTSIIDPEREDALSRDRDEALWEEAETGLRHQGRVTPNFMLLMALGGTIATVGLAADPVPQVIAFVAASIIAPGFEPLAKIPLGLALGRWPVVIRGLIGAVVGYAGLIAAAALAFWGLRAAGALTVGELVGNPEVERLAHPETRDLLVSACAALAGVTMIVAYRRSVMAGPLIALVLIPSAALIGAALSAGRFELASAALMRLGLDALFIVLLGVVLVLVKQATAHRRAPMI